MSQLLYTETVFALDNKYKMALATSSKPSPHVKQDKPMPSIRRDVIVPYQASDMYHLVNAIEDYPAFLPWCRHARILRQEAQQIEATLVLAKGGIHKAFTTRNTLSPNEHIQITLIDGPFKTLSGQWHFEVLSPNECHIHFELDFEFSTKILAVMLGSVFHQAVSTMIDCFCEEARKRHG